MSTNLISESFRGRAPQIIGWNVCNSFAMAFFPKFVSSGIFLEAAIFDNNEPEVLIVVVKIWRAVMPVQPKIEQKLPGSFLSNSGYRIAILKTTSTSSRRFNVTVPSDTRVACGTIEVVDKKNV